MIRINKFLARCNLGSRRQVEDFIRDGKVAVNGVVTIDLSTMVNPEIDKVSYNGKQINVIEDKIYLMLNKPKNYLVSSRDDFGRKLVYELLPDFGVHLFAIGRLDYNSEGLLLFTSDGDFANRIMHPRFKLPKVYRVIVKGQMQQEQIERLRKGVKIKSGKTQPALVHIKQRGENSMQLKITIYEGQKRQIRYMIKAVGSDVLELKRLQIGNVTLGKLPPGMWRLLKPSEVTGLQKLAH
ncbi:MAG: rRNA pseudouridine synthase [Candidatus Cloacimonetes bacterium]|nr:rRNA pseudouridine synthase [Candidatus Cloacimonadota bacterium]